MVCRSLSRCVNRMGMERVFRQLFRAVVDVSFFLIGQGVEILWYNLQ